MDKKEVYMDKKEINMRKDTSIKKTMSEIINRGAKMTKEGRIDTDPFGTWTGVNSDFPLEEPIQDVDDL